MRRLGQAITSLHATLSACQRPDGRSVLWVAARSSAGVA
jgi:hypothetical protein